MRISQSLKYNLLVSILGLMICRISETKAQRIVYKDKQMWLGYFGRFRISDKWGIWTDHHYRSTDDFVKKPFQSVDRVGAIYYINNDLQLMAGYGLINHFSDGLTSDLPVKEHRVWHQVQDFSKLTRRLEFMQWIRAEECFFKKSGNNVFEERISSNSNFNFGLLFFKKTKGMLSLVLNNEFYIYIRNAENQKGIYDQNRFFVGLAYPTNRQNYLQIGYLNVSQQNRDFSFNVNNNFRIYWFQNLNFSRKR